MDYPLVNSPHAYWVLPLALVAAVAQRCNNA